jgi:hypothetical protein
MKLMREARGIFGQTNVWKQTEWLLAILMFASGCLSVSVTPFLRKDMGERYFGWLNLYFGYSVLSTFFFVGPLASMFIHSSSIFPSMMTWFMLAFVGAAIYQRREIWKRNKSGLQWHTMFMGTSVLAKVLPISQEMIFKFVEPVLVWLLGHFLYSFNWEVGLWLYLAAFALAINNHLIFFNERQNILNIGDAQIEAQFYSAAMEGKPAAETHGFVLAESTRKLFGQDPKLREAITNLPSELQELLDAEPNVKGAA